jgi:hypothetical protein
MPYEEGTETLSERCFVLTASPMSARPTLCYRYVIRRVAGGLTVGKGSEKKIRCDKHF